MTRPTPIALCLTLLLTTAPARAEDVHQAARALAQQYKVSVVVFGGSAAAVNPVIGAKDAATALEALAAGSGLALKKKDEFWVLAPAAEMSKVEGARRGLPPGTRIDLDFQLVEADALLGTLAELMKLKLDGHVEGRLSIVGRGFGALTLIGVVSRVAGHEASRHAGRLVVSGALPGTPGATPPGTPAAAAAPPGTPAAAAPPGTPAAAAAPRAPDPAMTDVKVKVQRLGPTVAMLEGAGGNMGVSFGEDGIFLIDDEFAPLNAKILAALDTLAKQPLRFVFNTHWHGDHTGGNERLAGQGAVIVAHDNARLRLSRGQVSKFWKQTFPPAPPKALPVITFSDELSFHLNGDVLSVFHVAHAHTDGDAIVHFKKANVVHTGDTFMTSGYPFIDLESGGSIDGMVVAADKVLSLSDDGTKIIPGHGPVGDRKQLKAWREMLVTLRDRIAALKAQHRTLDEVVALRPSAEFDARFGASFIKPEMVVQMIYDSLGSAPPAAGSTGKPIQHH